MAHCKSTGRLAVHDRLAKYGASDSVFEIQITSIIGFGRSVLLHEFRKIRKEEAMSY